MRGKSLFILAVLTAACGNSEPINFAGTYAGEAVDGANACNFQNWTQGNSISIDGSIITQDGPTTQLTVPSSTGLGLVFLLVLGTNTFSGTVTGNEFTASYLGTKSATQGACSYTVNAKLDLTIDDKNNLAGTLTFTPATNGDPSCGVLDTCANVVNVTASRTQ